MIFLDRHKPGLAFYIPCHGDSFEGSAWAEQLRQVHRLELFDRFAQRQRLHWTRQLLCRVLVSLWNLDRATADADNAHRRALEGAVLDVKGQCESRRLVVVV